MDGLEEYYSFLVGLLSPFSLLMSPCAVHPPKAFLGGFYLHRSSFSKKSVAVPLASQLCMGQPFSGDTDGVAVSTSSLITSLRSLAVLHYIVLKNI